MRKTIGTLVSTWLAWRTRRRRESQYNHLARAGLNPFSSLRGGAPGGVSLEVARKRLSGGHIRVPNVSGFYHGILREYFDQYGLGARCLLVSETKAVAEVFGRLFPGTDFVSTDYYLDLQPDPKCHVVWDLCSERPPESLVGFQSIICQATLEHVLDPVQVLRNFSSILSEGGYLFVQTHTPAYVYHPYPRDYLRYQPDWFEDIEKLVRTLKLVELLCVDGHAFAVYRRE